MVPVQGVQGGGTGTVWYSGLQWSVQWSVQGVTVVSTVGYSGQYSGYSGQYSGQCSCTVVSAVVQCAVQWYPYMVYPYPRTWCTVPHYPGTTTPPTVLPDEHTWARTLLRDTPEPGQNVSFTEMSDKSG